jgi:hypothetical protein
MRIHRVFLRSTLALLAAGSFALSAPVVAQPISGAITLKITKQEVLPVTAQNGDMLMLVETHGTNKSSNWMDDAQVVNKEIDFLLQGNGPQHGYITFAKGEDTVDVKWSGIVSTAMANGQPQISFHGTWEQLKGTGKYQGIQGKGSYKGHFISQTEYVVDWTGHSNAPANSRAK